MKKTLPLSILLPMFALGAHNVPMHDEMPTSLASQRLTLSQEDGSSLRITISNASATNRSAEPTNITQETIEYHSDTFGITSKSITAIGFVLFGSISLYGNIIETIKLKNVQEKISLIPKFILSMTVLSIGLKLGDDAVFNSTKEVITDSKNISQEELKRLLEKKIQLS